MLVIAHDTDLHYGYNNPGPRAIKISHPEKIIATQATVVVVTGDLTNNGYDGRNINLGFTKIKYGGDDNQVKFLKEYYIDPIEASGKELFLCAGNHDRGKSYINLFRYQPVRKLIRKRHGANTYSFVRQGLRFLIMDEYPRELTWLTNKLRKHPDDPYIIAFHFNLEGPHSNWWSGHNKRHFYRAIKKYNILALLVGHHHISKVSYWKRIRVISSGEKFALITYDPELKVIVNVSFARTE